MNRIVVAEFPKSGGTWVVSMLADTLNFNKRDIYANSSYAGFDISKHPWYQKAENLSIPNNSVIKSHELPNSKLVDFDAKFIHLVRDGRDVAVSKYFYEKNFCTQNGIRKNFNKSFNNFIEEIALQWCSFVNKWLKSNAPTVRYEDFLNNSHNEIKKIIASLSIKDVNDVKINNAIEHNSKEKIKNSLDHLFKYNTFVRKGIAGDWKNHFKTIHNDTFKSIAGDTLKILGYYDDKKTYYSAINTPQISYKKNNQCLNKKIIPSPLSGSKETVWIKDIDTKWLTREYKKRFKIDVSPIFKDVTTIELRMCKDTGSKFYYPFNLEGDSNFYEKLEKIPWYYMDWKWEHATAAALITPDTNNLEIGCGKGSFIENISKKNISINGLEVNQYQIALGKQRGLRIYNQSIANHSLQFPSYYDNIFAFQVMEHISDVYTFIDSCLSALKNGGKLVISVPNHDSFMDLDDNNILDMPPHHMGLWDTKSITALQNIFKMRLIDTYFEPLQEYHRDWYLNIARKVFNNEIHICRALERMTSNYLENFLGATILAVFRKL